MCEKFVKINVMKGKIFVYLKKNFFGKTFTFSDLYNDIKMKALAAVVPEITTI